MVTEQDIRRVSASDSTTLSVYELNYLLDKIKVSQFMTKKVFTEDHFVPARALIARGLAEVIRIQVNHAVFPIFAAQKDQVPMVPDFNFPHFRVLEDLDPGPSHPIGRPI